MADLLENPAPRRQGASPSDPAIIAGLLADPPWIAPKYFYDPLGSQLFEIITQLPEYYPTRLERGIFAARDGELRGLVGPGSTLIDLGAGNCAKAEALFAALEPAQYIPVDIAGEFMDGAIQRLKQRHPGLEIVPVATDFAAGLSLPAAVRDQRRLFFYPGSSIGNFTPSAALTLLRGLHGQCAPGGHLLIGVDLLKDTALLEAAYNDVLGITAAFNRNVLNHLNRLIGSNFAVAGWRHQAEFNAAQGRIEMHLAASCEQTVRWPEGQRTFHAGQRLHTENSYKYAPEAFEQMLLDSGFEPVRCWTDPDRWFAVFLARSTS